MKDKKNKKRLIFVTLLGIVLLGFIAVQTFAESPTERAGRIREDVKRDKQDLRNDLKNLSQAQKGKIARLIDAQVTGKGETSLTVVKDGKTYTVNTDANIRVRRHFWGKSSLSEISVNDKVNVWGTWTDDSHTTILAKLIRDTSIMKRRGVFFGTIQSLGTNTFVLKTLRRGNQNVTISSTTKFVNRRQAVISFSDLKIGDKVRVKGMWDKINSTIAEVTHLKDFSIPSRTATPSPTTSL